MNFIEKTILEATTYVSGYVNKDDDYVISASMVGNDPLQNYLSIIHGKIGEEVIGDNTLGSVFHLGMKGIMQRKLDLCIANGETSNIIGIEKDMYVKLSNGWILSGTADLILNNRGSVEIHDYKLSKSYAKKKLKEQLTTHNYAIQLRVLDALFRENQDGKVYGIEGDIRLSVDFFSKDAKAIEFEPTYEDVVIPSKKGIEFEPTYEDVVIPSKRGTEDMSATEVVFGEVVEITNSLQAYIESGEIPPICKDRWPRNVKGKIIPIKCALYCSHGKAGLCPHYKNSDRTNVEHIVNW